MTQYSNISVLQKWFSKHTELGGEVYTTFCEWDWIGNPQKEIDKLFGEFKQIPFETIMEFVETEVTDNNMWNRNIMDDAAKVWWLKDQIHEYGTLMFPVQLLHEPWNNRYRVHPGSGRLMALWLAEKSNVKAIYVHWPEHNMVVPPLSLATSSYAMMHEDIKQRDVEPWYEVYSAFEKNPKDTEWNPPSSNIGWENIRFSEGPNFLGFKQDWRKYAMDLWHYLNNK